MGSLFRTEEQKNIEANNASHFTSRSAPKVKAGVRRYVGLALSAMRTGWPLRSTASSPATAAT